MLAGKDFTYVDSSGTTITARSENLLRSFLNSITVTVPAVVIPILVGGLLYVLPDGVI